MNTCDLSEPGLVIYILKNLNTFFGHELNNPVLIKAVKLCEKAGIYSPDESQKSRLLDRAFEAKFNGSRQVECYILPSSLKTEKLALKGRSRADLSPPERRLVNRFLLRRTRYGTSAACLKCNLHRVSVYHLSLCSGVDLDSLCHSHDWVAAARALMLASAECARPTLILLYLCMADRPIPLQPSDRG
jgi:hypothetical protein